MTLPPWVVPLITAGVGVLGNALAGRSQTNALKQAGTINQQATQDAMAQILGLYDQGRQDLSPYRAVGQPALNRLQTLAGHPQSSIGAKQTTNALRRPALSQPGNNALLDVVSHGRGPNSVGNSFGSTVGKATGGFFAAGIPGAIASLAFNRHGPDKEAGSRGAEELARFTWGTNQPNVPASQLTTGLVADVVQRRKTLAQGKEEFAAKWSEWVNAMKQAGVDDGIIQSSIQTQKQHFMPVKQTFDQLAAQGYV